MTGRMVTIGAALTIVLATISSQAQAQQSRLTPDAVLALPIIIAGAGTSGLTTVETRLIRVPPNTHIASHRHRDSRSAVVVSGVWRFGYGTDGDEATSEALPAGSFYTEPADLAHFAFTGAEGATVFISGMGPSDTHYSRSAISPN
jgi:uncharacterized RmlC-like cupin family protein